MMNFPQFPVNTEKRNRLQSQLSEPSANQDIPEEILNNIEQLKLESNLQNWANLKSAFDDNDDYNSFTSDIILPIFQLANQAFLEEDFDLSCIKINVICSIFNYSSSSIEYLHNSDFSSLILKIISVFNLTFYRTNEGRPNILHFILNINDILNSLLRQSDSFNQEISNAFHRIPPNLIEFIETFAQTRFKHLFLSTLKETIPFSNDPFPLFQIFSIQIELSNNYSSNNISLEAIASIVKTSPEIYENIASNEQFLCNLFDLLNPEYGCTMISIKILKPLLSDENIFNFFMTKELNNCLFEYYCQNINNSFISGFLDLIISLCRISRDCCQFFIISIFTDLIIPKSFYYQIELIKIIYSAIEYHIELPESIIPICQQALESNKVDILLPALHIVLFLIEQNRDISEFDVFTKLEEFDEEEIESQEVLDLIQLLLSKKP